MIHTLLLFVLLLSSSSQGWAATISDDFNCANADDIDCDLTWNDDPYSKVGDLRLQGNRVDNETAGQVEDSPRSATQLSTSNQRCTAVVTVVQPGTTQNRIGLSMRMNTSTTREFCACYLQVTSTGNERLFYGNHSNDTFTGGANIAVTYTAGTAATIRAEIIGTGTNNLTCTYDPGGANEASLQATCNDTTVALTNAVGFWVSIPSGSAAGDVSLDNFSCEDISTSQTWVIN